MLLEYKEYCPAPPLQPYVKCYFVMTCHHGGSMEDLAFPNGCLEVMFTLRGSQWQTRKTDTFTETAPVELWGQVLQPLPFRIHGPSQVFGIRFLPATAGILLRDDISAFNNNIVELAGVVGNGVLELHEQLQEAPSSSEQVTLADAFLIRRLQAQPKTSEKIRLIKTVMAEMTQKDFFDNISNVADRFGITSRYLQKVFVQYTGMTPKLYAKINRFQNAVVMLDKNKLSLTEIAYACGYFDQSHFIREFKTFTGITPSRFSGNHPTAVLASPNK